LGYAPPAGSTVIGGTVDVNLVSEGLSSATGVAGLYEADPSVGPDNDNALLFCAQGVSDCGTADAHYDGAAGLPAGEGGDVYVEASCGGAAGNQCSGGSASSYSVTQVISSDITLSNDAVPTGAGAAGTLVSGPASGTAQLIFTAADPQGPGVYNVTASIDGTTVYSQTPNTNGGACAAVGSSSGVLEFDGQPPCPASTSVDIPVATTCLANGAHQLAVTVTDAAGNASTVVDQEITVANPVTTSPPVHRRHEVHARFDLGWHFAGRTTRLRTITHVHLPGRGRVALECLGRRCPRLRLSREPSSHVRRLWRELERISFRPRQRLVITVSEPHYRSEPIELIFRAHRNPRVRLLKRTPRRPSRR
jgi:hypothetical protein